MTVLAPRVVVVIRPSAYRELLDRHGTPGAVEYFLRVRAPADLDDLRARDAAWTTAIAQVQAAVPAGWRTGRADRAELAAFPSRTTTSWSLSGRTGSWPTSPSTSTPSR